MCKHVAATLYGVGARLDHRPELLFTLRGVDPTEMVETAIDQGVQSRKRRSGRVLETGELSSVFGVDIDVDNDVGEVLPNEGASSTRRPGQAGKARGRKSRAKTAAAKKSTLAKAGRKKATPKKRAAKRATSKKAPGAKKATRKATRKVTKKATKASSKQATRKATTKKATEAQIKKATRKAKKKPGQGETKSPTSGRAPP
jgi:uncharacterized Zn finger protein